MKQFKITIERTSTAFHEFCIDAEGVEEAKDKALEMAGNHEFSEKSAEYRVEYVAPYEAQ